MAPSRSGGAEAAEPKRRLRAVGLLTDTLLQDPFLPDYNRKYSPVPTVKHWQAVVNDPATLDGRGLHIQKYADVLPDDCTVALLYLEDIYREDMEEEEAPANGNGPRAKARLQHLEGNIDLLFKTFPGRILIVGVSQCAAKRAYDRDYAGILDAMFVAARVKTAAEASVLERDGITYLNEMPEGVQKPTGRNQPGRKMRGQMGGGYYHQAADGQASPFYEVYIAVLKEGITQANYWQNTYDEKYKPKAEAQREQAKARREQAKAKAKPKAKPKASKFRGVSKFKRKKAKPWTAQIRVTEAGKKRLIHIGTFAREEDAARARDRVTIAKLGHAKAETNFPVAEYRKEWEQLEALGVDGAVARERERAKQR